MQQPSVETLMPVPTCPSCHTEDHTTSMDAVEAGARWRCTRCGQLWSARRLAIVAAYAKTTAA